MKKRNLINEQTLNREPVPLIATTFFVLMTTRLLEIDQAFMQTGLFQPPWKASR